MVEKYTEIRIVGMFGSVKVYGIVRTIIDHKKGETNREFLYTSPYTGRQSYEDCEARINQY